MDVIIIVGVVGRRFASWIGSMSTQCLTPVSLWHFLSVEVPEERLRRNYLANSFGKTARPEKCSFGCRTINKILLSRNFTVQAYILFYYHTFKKLKKNSPDCSPGFSYKINGLITS